MMHMSRVVVELLERTQKTSPQVVERRIFFFLQKKFQSRVLYFLDEVEWRRGQDVDVEEVVRSTKVTCV
jgi:uncharacterized protein (DUF1499 family)